MTDRPTSTNGDDRPTAGAGSTQDGGGFGHEGGGSYRGLGHIVLAAALGVALVGFYVGTRPGDASPVGLAEAPDAASSQKSSRQDVPQAVAYGELPEPALRPNGKWESHIAQLLSEKPDLFTAAPDSDRDPQAALAERAERRAYEGAPPVVPHPIDQRNAASCLACHRDGLKVGDRVAPRMSHRKYASCTQCHVESLNRQFSEQARQPLTESQFAGLEAPKKGNRAWPGAPPTIPHRTWMREDCMSCHGSLGDAAIRTPHPWRQSCKQCHTPSAELDQRDFRDLLGEMPQPKEAQP